MLYKKELKMKVSQVMTRFATFYIVGTLLIGIIAMSVKAFDTTVFSVILIVLSLRFVVSEYMQEHKMKSLSSQDYRTFFLASFGIVMTLNVLVLAFLLLEINMNSDVLAMSLVIGIFVNAVAVAAGLFQAKKAVLKKIKARK